MKLANCFGLVIVLALNVACNSTMSATSGETGPQIVTSAEFAAKPSSFHGREVTVQGYVRASKPELIIYPSKAAADESKYFENAVFVYDTSPNLKLSLEEFKEPKNCTEHYVELTGTGGFFKGRGFSGIVYIKTIKTFENDAFEGTGQICYP